MHLLLWLPVFPALVINGAFFTVAARIPGGRHIGSAGMAAAAVVRTPGLAGHAGARIGLRAVHAFGRFVDDGSVRCAFRGRRFRGRLRWAWGLRGGGQGRKTGRSKRNAWIFHGKPLAFQPA